MKKNKDKFFEKALGYSYRLLSYRPRSKKEITDRLKRKGFNLKTVNNVTKYLKKLNYINDEEFSRFWIRMRLLAKPCGVSLIYYELKNKGIDKELIDKTFEKFFPKYNERETALNLAKKYYSKNNFLKSIVLKRRLLGYLKRRGFNYSVIYDVINELI